MSNNALRLIILTYSIFFLVTTCNAAAINGYVSDAANGEPLPVASVVVKDTDRGAATNLDGYFVIDYIDPGVYTLLISNLGYDGIEMEVLVNEGISDPLQIEIKRGSMKLEEVEVVVETHGTGIERMAPIVSAVPVDSKIIRTMPSLGGEMDVLRALQTIPGVKASSDISSALHVRGGSPDQTLILMEHNAVYNPNHLFGIFSTFNADAVKHIDLMKGGFPAQYGGRSGSVLEILTNDGNRKETEGLFSIGMVSARVSLEGPLGFKKGSYAASYRRTYMEPIINMIRNSGNFDLPDYYFYDGNAKMNLDLSPRTTLSISGYWGNDELDFNFGPDDSRFVMGLNWGNRTLTSRIRHALGSKLFVSFGAAMSRYRSKWFIENDGVMLDKARGRLYDFSLKSDIEMLGAKNHKFKAGVWMSDYWSMFKEENQDMVWVDVNKKTINVSVYVQDQWKVNSRFEVQPGIRTYYHVRGEHFTVDPRLSVVYQHTEKIRFKAAGGRYSQFINVMSLGEAFSSFDVWFPIDETIDPAFSDQAVIGFEYDYNRLEFTSEAYYTEMHNVISMNPEVDEGTTAKDAFVQGDGDAYGLEFMLRKKSGRLNGWVGYSLSWTHRTYEGTLINDGNQFFPKWDRRHDFIFVGNYPLSKKWDMSCSWRYNTGQGYTQALGVFTVRHPGWDPSYDDNYDRVIRPGSKNNYRFPDDHKLDLSFIYNHTCFYNPAKLIISISNAYSRRPYYMRLFDTDENPVEVIDAKLLPILPLIAYEVRF